MSRESFPPGSPTSGSAWSRHGLKMAADLGAFAREHWRELRFVAAVIGTVLYTSIRPRYWNRNARQLFARQVLAVGVEPLGFVCAVAVFVGISVVVQLAFWVGEAGQSQLVGPLLVAVVARELGPVLINLVLIVRSGSAMTTELGVLKISGEVQSLEENGSDSFLHLVMPRVLGVTVSTFCLTIVFISVTFVSGYLFAAWTGKGSRDVLLFADTLSRAVHPKDVISILAKSILPALFASAACCIGGLGVRGSFAEIPEATQRALTRSVAGLFVISALVSLLTYL
jgi:phospholipid/cholesterol/gamma-HCH transport system permease protein